MRSDNGNNIVAQFLSQLFTELKNAKVIYCVLGGYEKLPYEVVSDLDIWVKPGDQAKLYDIIRNISRELGWKIIKPNVSPRLSSTGEGKYYLLKREPPLLIIHIDCWTYLHWRGIVYVDQEVFPNHIHYHEKGFSVLTGPLDVGFSLLKDLLDKLKIADKRKDKTIQYLRHDCTGLQQALKVPFGVKMTETFIELARSGKWEELEKLGHTLRFLLICRAVILSPVVQLKRWFIYACGIIKLFSIQYGNFIVFIGPDGCGKTTVAKRLLESSLINKLFEKKFYFHTRFPFLPSFKQIAYHLQLIDQDAVISEGKPRRIDPRSPLNCIVHSIYYGLNNFLGRFWIRKQKTRGGSLILFDRYFFEYLIQWEFSRCPRSLVRGILRFIPRPDIIIFLENDPNVIYERKRDLSLAEIARQMDMCREVIKSYPEAFVVSTKSTPEAALQQISQIILDRLVEDSAQ